MRSFITHRLAGFLFLLSLFPLVVFAGPHMGGLGDDDHHDRGKEPKIQKEGHFALAKHTLLPNRPQAAAVVPASGEITQSSLRVEQGGRTFALPLMHTDVEAEISGFVADVAVHQLYSNPFEQPIEAVYLFPLPDNAAVDDMQMRIGDRVIVGEIKRRAEAKQIYEAARDAGKTASLLDQERPNVFQQSVANILPGESIEITIHFVQRLDYEDGGYEWAFPMVVGPRFIPEQGTGRSGGTPQGDDEDRLSAPVSAERTGNDITVSVTVDAGLPIQKVQSSSHDIEVDRPAEDSADIVLSASDTIPNKDFVLRYEVAGSSPETAFLTHRNGDDGYFMLMLQPQSEDNLTQSEVTPKEMVFVIDTSCSQSGEPLARAKEAVELAIDEMNPQDRFWVLNFNSSVSSLSSSSLPNNATNRRRGIDYIRGFKGGGGTNMLEGIQAALDLPSDERLLRTVVLMTDGYIGNETEILNTIEQRLGNSRIFSFGVGSSTNRYLLNQMAKVGRGHVQYIRQDEDPQDQVAAFYDRIRNPVLTDIEVEWSGVELNDIYPDPIPDLFSAQPLVLVGRYAAPGRGKLTITGRIRGEEYSRTLSIKLPARQEQHDALASLWGRTVIEDLEARRVRDADPNIAEEIIELALSHRLMTRETSFVAVEERVVTDGSGASKRVRIPLETPQGVDHSAIFAESDDLERTSNRIRGTLKARSKRYEGSVGLGGTGRRGTGTGGGGLGGASVGAKGRSFSGRGAGGYGRAAGHFSANTKEAVTRKVQVPAPEPSAEPTDDSPARLRTDVTVLSGIGLPESTHRLIKRRIRGLQAAWESWARAHPEAAGGLWKLRVSFDSEGRVVGVTFLNDAVGVASLAKSFESQALAWTLPRPTEGDDLHVEFQLHFSAER